MTLSPLRFAKGVVNLGCPFRTSGQMMPRDCSAQFGVVDPCCCA
jgi:hypothetical protein